MSVKISTPRKRRSLNRAVGSPPAPRRSSFIGRQAHAPANRSGCCRDELRHLVVRDARAFDASFGSSTLSSSARDRQQMQDVGVLVHRAEADVEIGQPGLARKYLPYCVASRCPRACCARRDSAAAARG
jgi:hypothetical protein